MNDIPEFNTFNNTEEITESPVESIIDDDVIPDTYEVEATESPKPVETESDEIVVEVNQPAVNFETKRTPAQILESVIENTDFRLAFIAENPETTKKILEAYDVVLGRMSNDELVTKQKDREWLESIILGLNYTNENKAPIGATYRENSRWTQGIYSNDSDVLIRPGRPAQKIDKTKRYSKEELLSYLSRKSGGGGTYDIMLPCSGLWLRLREPSLSEVVSLLTEIESNKVTLGMQTKGLAFSNAQAVAANSITTLALECVIAANVNFNTPGDLEELISSLDEPLLHYALAAVMYPDGFNYKVPCIANINNCSEVIDFKLNMSNIIWYDDLKFTKEQRRLWARRFTRISSESEIKEYQEAFSLGDDKIFWFNDIGVKLTIPNLFQRRVYVDAWIESLIEMTSSTFNEPPEGPNRSRYIDKLNNASKALHYGQWVKGIYEKDEDSSNIEDQLISDDPDVIKEFLSSVLSKDELVDKFFEAVAKFSNDSVTGLVALPSHNCSSCNGTQGNVLNERFPHLVPIDVIPVFFTLAGLKVQKIQG